MSEEDLKENSLVGPKFELTDDELARLDEERPADPSPLEENEVVIRSVSEIADAGGGTRILRLVPFNGTQMKTYIFRAFFDCLNNENKKRFLKEFL
jgi:hypothetical protein